MRLVFWLFLVLNLAFFYWQYSQPQKAEPALTQTESLPAGVERLVLLRERGLDAPSRLLSSAVADVEPEPSAAVVAQSGKDAASVPAPLKKEVKKEAQPAPASKPEPGLVPEPEPPAPPVMACFVLGPFKDESDAGLMYKALLGLGVTPEQRLTERREVKGYWVYLPPLKSYADAQRKVQALKDKGLDDMYIMGKGEMKNAISLGIFSRKSTATERFNQVRRLEPATMMKPRYRRIKEKWLDLRVDSAQTEMIADIAALAARHAGIELVQRKACK